MLSTRLVFGFLMAGALVSVLIVDEWVAPWFPFWFLTALIVLNAASLELVGLLGTTTAQPSGNTVFGGVSALVVANWAPHIVEHLSTDPRWADRMALESVGPISVFAWPLFTFAALVMATFVIQSLQFRNSGGGGTIATISVTLLAIAYIGVLGGFIMQMRWLDGSHHGVVPLVLLVSTAKGADIGAYTLGRLVGRRRLWPLVSPRKTVEGAVGGLVFAILAAVLVSMTARHLFGVLSFGLIEAVGFGVCVGTAAQLGDLMESMIKRDCARKDASDAVPGFGGVLDVLDSLLFAAPVAFGYWLWLGP